MTRKPSEAWSTFSATGMTRDGPRIHQLPPEERQSNPGLLATQQGSQRVRSLACSMIIHASRGGMLHSAFDFKANREFNLGSPGVALL